MPTETKANGTAAVNKPVLQDISLHVPAGSILAIVGPTGSGKSTLAALIARLWDAPPGTLLIDGRPIREWPLETLRRAVGYVPQDTFLFSETLRENVAFGVDERDRRADSRRRRRRQHRRGNRRVPRASSTPWSANAASRFPAARSSARPLPAP